MTRLTRAVSRAESAHSVTRPFVRCIAVAISLSFVAGGVWCRGDESSEVFFTLKQDDVTDETVQRLFAPFQRWVKLTENRKLDATCEMMVTRGDQRALVKQSMRMISNDDGSKLHFTLLDDSQPLRFSDETDVESNGSKTDRAKMNILHRATNPFAEPGNERLGASMIRVRYQPKSFFREFPADPNWRPLTANRAGKWCSYRDLRYLPLHFGSILAATFTPKFDPPKLMRMRPFQLAFHEDGSVTSTWVVNRSIARVHFDANSAMLPTSRGSWEASIEMNFDPSDPAQLKGFENRLPRVVANRVLWKESLIGWGIETLSMQFSTPFNPAASRLVVHAEFRYCLHPELVTDEVFQPRDDNIQLPVEKKQGEILHH